MNHPPEQQTVVINCTPEQLFGYISKPWRWHEWHPNSKGSTGSGEGVRKGEYRAAMGIIYHYLLDSLHTVEIE